MTSTFLVTLNLPDISADTLDGIAETIQEILLDDFNVLKVEPWARPVTAPKTLSPFYQEPPASAIPL